MLSAMMSLSTRIRPGVSASGDRGATTSSSAGAAFCAPAADSVAADALGETLTLPDKRVTLPSRGCLGPVRVCRPCHFRAYEL